MGEKISVDVGDLRTIKSLAECEDTTEIISVVDSILTEAGIDLEES